MLIEGRMQALEPEVQGQIWGLLYTALCALGQLAGLPVP